MEQSFSEWKVAEILWLGKGRGGNIQKLWPEKNLSSCQAAGEDSDPSGVAKDRWGCKSQGEALWTSQGTVVPEWRMGWMAV